jgi:hypothetical protein
MMATRHTGSIMISKDSEAWETLQRLLEEDRAESAPAQREDDR